MCHQGATPILNTNVFISKYCLKIKPIKYHHKRRIYPAGHTALNENAF